jgi:acyl-CoA thioester hydrolase
MAEFPVSTDIPVRFRDCDPMNHVNNAVYATYLEVGRQEYWSRFLDPGDYHKVPFIVARVEIDYISPLATGETVRVFLRTAWIGEHSFATEYELRSLSDDRVVARARTIQATYDYDRRQVIPVPEHLRQGLEAVEGHPIPPKPGQ